MAIDRTTRETKSRANNTRRKPWSPPSKLDAPPAPEGYTHRWIRTAIQGDDDKTNVFAKMREGWEPVRAEEYGPEADKYPVIEEGKNNRQTCAIAASSCFNISNKAYMFFRIIKDLQDFIIYRIF